MTSDDQYRRRAESLRAELDRLRTRAEELEDALDAATARAERAERLVSAITAYFDSGATLAGWGDAIARILGELAETEVAIERETREGQDGS